MSKVKYLYVRNPWDRRDITIASDIVEENGKKFVKFGWAFRSNHDQFIKREGRTIALNRMLNNHEEYSSKVEVEAFKFYDIAEAVLNVIVSNEYTPKKYKEDILSDIYFYRVKSRKHPPSWAAVDLNA